MNAPVKISQTNSTECPSMMAHAERWRAQCIQQFAEIEVIVEDLLRALRRSPKFGQKIRTGEMVGVAFGHLRELTASKELLGQKGAATSLTLDELAPWFEWRAHLTHGVLSLWRGNNAWLLTFAHRPVGSDPVRFYALPWSEAQQLQKLLNEKVEKLRSNAEALVCACEGTAA